MELRKDAKIMKKRILSLLTALAIMFSAFTTLGVSASALTTNSYNCKTSKTLTVKTGASKGSITFKCTGNSYTKKANTILGTKTYKHTCTAPRMTIKVSPAIDGKSVFFITDATKGTTNTSTLKGLKANTTYKITVSYNYTQHSHCGLSGNWDQFHNIVGNGYDWANGTWKVTGTKNIISIK